MEQYIDKDALVAEIESKIKEWRLGSSSEAKFRIEVYKELSEWLDTLEVKEVDLESEWVKYFENRGDMATVNIKHLAKHFFELGMAASNKAQKGK